MGNKNMEISVRGDLDVGLTNAINECDEKSFAQVIQQLHDWGTIDAKKVSTKSDLIQALSAMSEKDKEEAAESLNNGTFFNWCSNILLNIIPNAFIN